MVEYIPAHDIACRDDHKRNKKTGPHSADKTVNLMYPFLNPFKRSLFGNTLLTHYFHSGGNATTFTPLFSHSSLYILTTSLALSPFPSKSLTHFLVTSLNLSYHRSASL